VSNNLSEKYVEAINTLPKSLHPVFKDMVDDYRYTATLRYNKPFVSYIVLADMVKAGWRRSAEELSEE